MGGDDRRPQVATGEGAAGKLRERVEWDLTVGAHASDFVRAALEAGDPVPEDLIQPRLDPEWELAYAAFSVLIVGHDGAIPWTAIDAYARRYRISGLDRFEEFFAQVRAIESVWRDLIKKPESK